MKLWIFIGEREVNETRALLRVEKFIVDQAEVDQKVGGGDELAENEDAVTEEGAYDTQTEDAGNTANEGRCGRGRCFTGITQRSSDRGRTMSAVCIDPENGQQDTLC